MPKTRNRPDLEDRAMPYRLWRWGRLDQAYPTDCDQIEWRIKDGQMVPVAVIELTRRDPKKGYDNPPKAYFDAILNRYKSDAQAHCATHVAQQLDCKAWIVVFEADLSNFYVYNLSNDRGWWTLNEKGYETWLQRL